MDIVDESRPPAGTETAALVRIHNINQSDDNLYPSRIPLTGQIVTVGRGVFNNIIILDKQLSRTHSKLAYDKRNWHILDQSMNGIWVNGVRLQREVPFKLENGAFVQFIPDANIKYRIEYVLPEAEVEAGPSSELGVKKLNTHRNGSMAPASSNITTGFQRLNANLGSSDDEGDSFKTAISKNDAHRGSSSKLKLDQGEAMVCYESDCIIIEDSRDRPENDDIEVVAVVGLAESPAKVSVLNSEQADRLKLMEEVEFLRKELANEKKSHQEESEELLTSIKLLESELVLQTAKPMVRKLDLINSFLDLGCYLCKTQCIEPVRLHPCGHLFCAFCINESIKTTNTRKCPWCGRQIEDQCNDVVLDNLISEGFTVMPQEILAERQQRSTQRSNSAKPQ